VNKYIWLPAIVVFVMVGCSSTRSLVIGNTNECMNLPWHGYPIDGTQVRLLECVGKPNEQWNINNGQNVGVGQITSIGGSCLDVQGSAPVDGARIISVACNGSPSQQWNVTQGQVVGIGGKCLDVEGGNPNNYAPLVLAACHGAPSQQWTVH